MRIVFLIDENDKVVGIIMGWSTAGQIVEFKEEKGMEIKLKHAVVTLLMILTLISIVGCEKDETGELLDISLNGEDISFEEIKDPIYKEDLDYKSLFETYFMKIENEVEDSSAGQVYMDFSAIPDELIIKDILLDSNGSLLYSTREIMEMPFYFTGESASFIINAHPASLLGLEYAGREVEYRGYLILAKWGNVEKLYCFAVKNNTKLAMNYIENYLIGIGGTFHEKESNKYSNSIVLEIGEDKISRKQFDAAGKSLRTNDLEIIENYLINETVKREICKENSIDVSSEEVMEYINKLEKIPNVGIQVRLEFDEHLHSIEISEEEFWSSQGTINSIKNMIIVGKYKGLLRAEFLHSFPDKQGKEIEEMVKEEFKNQIELKRQEVEVIRNYDSKGMIVPEDFKVEEVSIRKYMEDDEVRHSTDSQILYRPVLDFINNLNIVETKEISSEAIKYKFRLYNEHYEIVDICFCENNEMLVEYERRVEYEDEKDVYYRDDYSRYFQIVDDDFDINWLEEYFDEAMWKEEVEFIESLIPEGFQPVLIFMNKYSEETVIKKNGDDTTVINDVVGFIKEIDIDIEDNEIDVYPERRYSISLFNSVNERVSIDFNEDSSIWYRYDYRVKDKKSEVYHFEGEFELYQISNSQFDSKRLEDIFSGLDDY